MLPVSCWALPPWCGPWEAACWPREVRRRRWWSPRHEARRLQKERREAWLSRAFSARQRFGETPLFLTANSSGGLPQEGDRRLRVLCWEDLPCVPMCLPSCCACLWISLIPREACPYPCGSVWCTGFCSGSRQSKDGLNVWHFVAYPQGGKIKHEQNKPRNPKHKRYLSQTPNVW